jgi:pimeloyl-ACP methyl ester carboxylesterase
MPAIRATDGREVMYAEWGDPKGVPIFALHGTPGCRLNRPPEEGKVRAEGIRLVTYDRPGYGASDRYRDRRVVDCAADVEALADALDIDRFGVTGGSGGGPHALAVGARLADRVFGVHCVVGCAPYDAPGLDWFAGMDPENVKEFGWALDGEERLITELTALHADVEARVAADPTKILEGFDLPDADTAILADPRIQELIREAVAEECRLGVGGWADDDLAFVVPWGFDVSELTVPVEVRYGAADVLVPAAHGEWLAANVPNAVVHVDTGNGHMATPDEALGHLSRLAHGG